MCFDVETDGLVVKGQPPPNLVQLAALLIDNTGRERGCISLLIQPIGFWIPDRAAAVHGITTEIALCCGVPLIVAVGMLSNMIKISTAHVAHNAEFDHAVIAGAFHHVNRPLPPINLKCTKELASPILNLPPTERMLAAGFNKPKAPSLKECIKHFFNEDLIDAHDALADARACSRIYLELQRLSNVQ
jgi:DNA polymerase-3 subunit epsilon